MKRLILLPLLLVAVIASFASLRDELLERATTADANLLYRIALAFESGAPDLEPDSTLAMDLLRKSAGAGSSDAINYLGYKTLSEGGDIAKGLRLMEEAAAMGNPKAFNNLGWLYTDGSLVGKDLGKAIYWLERGADAGVASSMSMLGDLLSAGIGVEHPDTLRADSLYRAAAAKGLPEAQAKLLMLNRDRYDRMTAKEALREGKGLMNDNIGFTAAYVLERAAELGSHDAEAALGFLYSTGRAGTLDSAKGLQYLYRAAAGGNPSAQFILAETLEMMPDLLSTLPAEAVSGSLPSAWELYDLAAAQGVTDAATAVRLLAAKPQAPDDVFRLGADISGVTELEARGEKFYDSLGVETDLFELMKDYGINGIRLRVWVDPAGGFCSPQDVLAMAKRAKAAGMPVMVDFHYSDWWADPGKQNIPSRWKQMNLEEMKGAVAEHTAATLQMLRDAGIDVPWVQVGNETTNGMLWPTGNANDNMGGYAALTQAGYDAVKAIYPDAQVIVHLDNGFDEELYNRIFDGLRENGTQWDMIGMSLYPYWSMKDGKVKDEQELLDRAIANINALKAKYGTDVMIVEAGVEANKPDEGKAFMQELISRAKDETDGACKGVWYWAPEADGVLDGYKLGAFQNRRPTPIMDAFRLSGSK